MKGGYAKTAEWCYASTGIIALTAKPNINNRIAQAKLRVDNM